MTVTVYRSTDASAPNLQGQSGTLITVLDAVLVNGYGAVSAAGWTKPFSGTNKAVYRMATSGNTGFYLNVQDNAPGAGGAREARVWGYEVASAQDTGTGQFPTSAQMSTGLFVRKSNTADSTNRPWVIVADASVFYLFVETGDLTSPTMTYSLVFGDIFAYKASDAYGCIIIGRNGENTNDSRNEPLCQLLNPNNSVFLTATIAGHYMPRSWTTLGTALVVGKHIDQTRNGAGALGNASSSGTTLLGTGQVACIGNYSQVTPSCFAYPNQPDGGLWLSPIWIHHNGAVRGYLKGLWAPLHDRPLNHGDTFSGAGAMAGKSFLIQGVVTASNNAQQLGEVAIETSNTWS